jgi:hypothetical protein
MTLNLGPFEDGEFKPVLVTSIRRNRAPCRLVRATQSAALAIDVPVSDVRRGMVMIDPHEGNVSATMLFQVSTSLPSALATKRSCYQVLLLPSTLSAKCSHCQVLLLPSALARLRIFLENIFLKKFLKKNSNSN